MTKLKSKRLLSLFLSLAMVFTLTVTPALAANDTSSGTETGEASSASAATFSEPEAVEAEAVAAVEASDEGEELVVAAEEEEENYGISLASDDGEEVASELPTAENGVITLIEDVELAAQYEVTDTVTIELNGHSITRASSNTTAALIKVTSGTLTVQDTSEGASGYIDGDVYTKTTTDDDGIASTSTYIGYAILTSSAVVLTSGTLKGYRGVYVSGDNASLTVNGGTVSGTYSASDSYAIYQTGGTVNVTSGTVTGYWGIYGSAGTLNASGGTVSGTQMGILANGSLNVNVSGTAVVTGAHSGIYGYQSSYTGTVTISGGTVGGSSTSFGVNMQAGTAAVTGGTITASSYGLYSAGTTTITGGTISGYYAGVYALGTSSNVTINGENAVVKSTSTSETDTSTTAIAIWKGATVTIENGTVTGGYCGVGIYGEYNTDDSETRNTLNVKGGSIEGIVFGIATNGSYYYTDITISGGSVSGVTAMYLPAMESTTTITGGTITGSSTGIEIRAGSLTVTGGTITSTYTDTFATENNGSGTTVVGAGIAVSQHTTDNAITVEITGGTISGIYGVYEINYNTDNTSSVSVTVEADEDGNSATITTTDSSQGVAVYSTSLDEDSESTAKNSCTSVAISAGTYNTDVSEYYDTTSSYTAVVTTTTDEDGNETTSYTVVETVEGAVAIVLDDSGNYKGSTASLSYISALADNYTVQLIADVEEKTFTLRSNTGVTLDLNGHSMTCTDNSSYPYSPIYVTGGSLTVIDSTAEEGEVGDSVLSTTKGNGVVFVTGGDVTIEAGNYISYSSSGQTVQMSTAATESTVTIKNGTFTSVGYGMQVQAGTLNIKGGTIASSVTTIEGDETAYTPSVRGAVLVRASTTTDGEKSFDIIPTLNITGGYFTSVYNSTGMIVYAVDKTTAVNVDFTDYISISGGYYDMNNYSVARYVADGYEVADNTGDNSETYLYVVQETAVESGEIGYGYATIADDGTVTAYVMGTYTDLSGAIYRANKAYSDSAYASDDSYYAYVQFGSEGSLSLTSSVGSSSTYPKLIIDLNGATISSTATVFQVGADSELILLDSAGTATVTSSVATAGTLRNAGGTLTVYGGTYSNTDTTNSYSPVIYSANVNGGSATDATTTIYGGTFNSKGRAIHLNLGGITLYGGTYTAKALCYQADSETNTVSYPDGYDAFVTNTDSSTETTYYTWIVAVALGIYDSTTTVPGEITSGYGTSTLYVSVSASDISNNYSTTAYPTTSLTFTDDNDEEHTYIFAGWYSYSDDTYTAMTSFPESNAYAKFVDADCLRVICVYTPAIFNENGKDALRFFSSMDSLSCQGFGFVVNDETYTCTSYITDHTITNSSMNRKFTSADVSENANILMTYRIYVDSLAESYSVYAYWVTGDGTKVCGSVLAFEPSSAATASTVYGE